MRKEVVIAIIVGFTLGLVITFGIYTANKALKKQTQPTASLAPSTQSTSPLASPTFTLEITEPENNLVVNKNKITVSGKTAAQTVVAIIAEDFDDLVLSDNDGVFSLAVPLTTGSNEIKITAINKNGTQEEKILSIVYTTAKIE